MGMMLNQLIAQTENVTPPNRLIELFMWFTINRENPWARKKIEDIFIQIPGSLRSLSETCCVLGHERVRRAEKP